MKRNLSYIYTVMACSFCFLMCLMATSSCRTKVKSGEAATDSAKSQRPVNYNIYVENSGSMAGYCNPNDTGSVETLIDDYYDRLNSSLNESDSITLNFISASIEKYNISKEDYLKTIKSKCKAKYTKLDSMLSLIMDRVTDKDVNILVSDYVFTTNTGNYATASSTITSIFSKSLRDKDMAVAIFKYMRNFNGIYYPGGLTCHKPLPLYVWFFGNRQNVRKVIDMPFNTTNCGTYFLQKPSAVNFKLEADKARMVSKDGKSIIVSEWEPVRHQDYYEITIKTNLSDVLLTPDEILDKSNYAVTSNSTTKYVVIKVEQMDDTDYNYALTLRTDGNGHPSPGKIKLAYPIKEPAWVQKSNFSGSGIPADSTTCGISYLIGGVSKAYKDYSKNNNNYFEINIKLE